MSDVPSPNGSAGDSTPASGGGQIRGEAAAIEALKGLLSADEPQQESPPPPAQGEGDDVGSLETTTTGDEDDGTLHEITPEAEAPPAALDPPSSWSSDDAAVFKSLPPAAQAVIARRESERDRAFLAKTQELAEHRSVTEGERETYARSLNQLLMLTVPELQQFQQIDWQQLSAADPATYVRLTEQRNQLRQRVDALQGEQARVQQQMEANQARRRAEVLAAEKQRLIETVPEFRDPAKAEKLAADLTKHLAEYGYSADEVAQAIDHRAIRVARDAMQWRQHVAARAAAEAKRTTGQAPTMQSPGTQTQAGASAERRINEKMSRLKQTGSVRDAAAMIRELL